MKQFCARVAFAKAPVYVVPAKAVQLTTTQLEQLQKQLRHADFWKLTSCQGPDGALDGAYWFLEAREAGCYHVVYRHSPDENDKFRRCCELLLDWSAARREERY